MWWLLFDSWRLAGKFSFFEIVFIDGFIDKSDFKRVVEFMSRLFKQLNHQNHECLAVVARVHCGVEPNARLFSKVEVGL